jgi:hypothetical protein
VLFKIATDSPGFAGGEAGEHLDEKLSLPPLPEERREVIGARLKPIPARSGAASRQVGLSS